MILIPPPKKATIQITSVLLQGAGHKPCVPQPKLNNNYSKRLKE